MNKNIKRIIAIVMAIGTVSAISPVTNSNLLTTKAYASTTNDETELDSLKLETSTGDSIKLYSDNDYKSDNKVNSGSVSEGDTYYAKTENSTVSINTSGPNSRYVRVFKGTSNSTKGKRISSDISLSSGSNTITVRVYSEEPDSNVDYGDSYESQYIIKVKCSASDTSSSSDSYDDIYLSKLSIDGESISLSDSKTTYTYNVASSVDEVVIKATPKDEDEDTVKIDDDTVDSDDKYKKTVSLDKGDNEIEVKVTNEDDEERVYTLKINRGGSTSNNSTSTTTTAADDYDEIYLEKLSVDGTSVELSDSKINYSYNVANDTDEVTVKATPQDEDEDTVEIDGDEVDSGDKYRKTISLSKGDNKIKINLTNSDDEERAYTLNVIRGTSTSSTTNSTSATTTTTSSPSTATEVTTAKVNQWVQTNGVWKYNDATGNPLKNTWVQNYYVKDDGSMVTGWFQIGQPWYYFGTDGAKKTGWQQVNGAWYYLESAADGKMKIGWMKDTNGKYYYLNDNGSMASNTTIQGYKLGRDGAWTK